MLRCRGVAFARPMLGSTSFVAISGRELTLAQGWYLTSSVGWFYVSFGFFLGVAAILMAAINFGALRIASLGLMHRAERFFGPYVEVFVPHS